jgi:SagB-type dehydrogenase family enzyme
VREFRTQGPAEIDLGQLLWAAQGISGPDTKRTGPSAGALYPLELYIAVGEVRSIATGVYRYIPQRHELIPIVPDCQWDRFVDATHGQDWINNAVVVVCIAACFMRTTNKYGARGRGYVYMEAGHAAENLMLQAVALELGTTMVAYGYKSVPRCGGGQHFPGTTSLDACALIDQLRNILREFVRHGVRKIALVVGHMENLWFVTEACDPVLRDLKALDMPSPRIMNAGYWDFISQETIARAFEGRFPDWSLEHAGIMAPSLMLYKYPDLEHRMVS